MAASSIFVNTCGSALAASRSSESALSPSFLNSVISTLTLSSRVFCRLSCSSFLTSNESSPKTRPSSNVSFSLRSRKDLNCDSASRIFWDDCEMLSPAEISFLASASCESISSAFWRRRSLLAEISRSAYLIRIFSAVKYSR